MEAYLSIRLHTCGMPPCLHILTWWPYNTLCTGTQDFLRHRLWANDVLTKPGESAIISFFQVFITLVNSGCSHLTSIWIKHNKCYR